MRGFARSTNRPGDAVGLDVGQDRPAHPVTRVGVGQLGPVDDREDRAARQGAPRTPPGSSASRLRGLLGRGRSTGVTSSTASSWSCGSASRSGEPSTPMAGPRPSRRRSSRLPATNASGRTTPAPVGTGRSAGAAGEVVVRSDRGASRPAGRRTGRARASDRGPDRGSDVHRCTVDDGGGGPAGVLVGVAMGAPGTAAADYLMVTLTDLVAPRTVVLPPYFTVRVCRPGSKRFVFITSATFVPALVTVPTATSLSLVFLPLRRDL